MAARRRLIVVSNRGPVSYDRGLGGERVERRGGGGLATALRGLLRRDEVTWVASAMTDEDRVVAAERGGTASDEITADGFPFRLRLVAHDPAAYDLYYNRVANPVLWFIQHRLVGVPVIDDAASFATAWRDGYAAVNQGFAAAVIDELDRTPDAAVFFHDYHLYLAPRFVRTARPAAVLSHFVHIPWVEASAWLALPEEPRRSLHDGLLANDIVGFHTTRWQRAFEQSAVEIAGAQAVGDDQLAYDGRTVRVTAHPISVDPGEFEALRDDEAVLEEERRIEASRPELLVVRVDRTDPSKNVVRGIQAFGRLLERHPELVGRAGLLALLDPSRQEIPVYIAYRAEIDAAALAVNERFSGRPVDLQVRDNFPQTIAAYKQYDVLFVNPVYDGLNLVAKEGPLVNRRDGVLILSENAGAYEELGPWVVAIDPLDVSGQADALYEALTQSAEERRLKAAATQSWVRDHDIARWIDEQLADLARVTG